ncbi:hypothetical protein PG996_011004 [Apiospora saccharicola]|uniref:Uncharacterized protein n=1 Tax=Apiospora saccharicola TaxID=335842 RepID=A0ABR1UED7_9PEZI
MGDGCTWLLDDDLGASDHDGPPGGKSGSNPHMNSSKSVCMMLLSAAGGAGVESIWRRLQGKRRDRINVVVGVTVIVAVTIVVTGVTIITPFLLNRWNRVGVRASSGFVILICPVLALPLQSLREHVFQPRPVRCRYDSREELLSGLEYLGRKNQPVGFFLWCLVPGSSVVIVTSATTMAGIRCGGFSGYLGYDQPHPLLRQTFHGTHGVLGFMIWLSVLKCDVGLSPILVIVAYVIHVFLCLDTETSGRDEFVSNDRIKAETLAADTLGPAA